MLLFIILDWSPNFSDKKCVWTNATFAAQTAILATEWHLSEMIARFSNFVGVLVTRHIGGRRTPGRPNTPRPTEKLQERVLTLFLFMDKCQSINIKNFLGIAWDLVGQLRKSNYGGTSENRYIQPIFVLPFLVELDTWIIRDLFFFSKTLHLHLAHDFFLVEYLVISYVWNIKNWGEKIGLKSSKKYLNEQEMTKNIAVIGISSGSTAVFHKFLIVHHKCNCNAKSQRCSFLLAYLLSRSPISVFLPFNSLSIPLIDNFKIVLTLYQQQAKNWRWIPHSSSRRNATFLSSTTEKSGAKPSRPWRGWRRSNKNV